MLAHVRFAAILREGRIFTFTLDFDAWPEIEVEDTEEAVEEADRRARAGRPLKGSFDLGAPHDCSRDYWTIITPSEVLHVAVVTDNAVTITGKRHDSPEANGGRGCLCGCHWVEGLRGALVVDEDTPKLLMLAEPLCVLAFEVPSPTGRTSRAVQVAYALRELPRANRASTMSKVG